jgi:hypothetical protein
MFGGKEIGKNVWGFKGDSKKDDVDLEDQMGKTQSNIWEN